MNDGNMKPRPSGRGEVTIIAKAMFDVGQYIETAILDNAPAVKRDDTVIVGGARFRVVALERVISIEDPLESVGDYRLKLVRL